jgi:hypothetical protein
MVSSRENPLDPTARQLLAGCPAAIEAQDVAEATAAAKWSALTSEALGDDPEVVGNQWQEERITVNFRSST